MFNLGFGEIAVILVILLIVVGPSRLPTVMKSTGKAMRTLRQASRDIQTSVGLDEMMREDLLRPTPPKRMAPQPQAPGTAPRVPAAAEARAAAPAEPSVATPPADTDGPTRGGTA